MTEAKISEDISSQKEYARNLQLMLLQRASEQIESYIEVVGSHLDVVAPQKVMPTLWFAQEILTICTNYTRSLHYTNHLGNLVACLFNEINEYLQDPKYPQNRIRTLAEELTKKD
ncbi:MAG TPA: hypothetical protein PKL04_10270 [Methanofastidiosum sp.]|nr:hypothetical protein [Methanofastidiosum sp.]